MISFVSDSACDLPDDLIKQHNIHIVPLRIHINDEMYYEKVDISAQEFYQKMSVSAELPKTSQPTPEAFAKVFKELSAYGPVLCITISSGLSGTYQAACIGRELSGADVTIFDSLGGSLGHGLQLLKAVKLVESGLSLAQTVEELQKYREEMKTLVLLNTLENIVKGGRLSKSQGAIGRILGIHVLLENGEQGKVVMYKKVMGKKKFINVVAQRIAELCPDMTGRIAGITHYNNMADAQNIKRILLEKHHADMVLMEEMGTTMATYAGDGGMIVAF